MLARYLRTGGRVRYAHPLDDPALRGLLSNFVRISLRGHHLPGIVQGLTQRTAHPFLTDRTNQSIWHALMNEGHPADLHAYLDRLAESEGQHPFSPDTLHTLHNILTAVGEGESNMPDWLRGYAPGVLQHRDLGAATLHHLQNVSPSTLASMNVLGRRAGRLRHPQAESLAALLGDVHPANVNTESVVPGMLRIHDIAHEMAGEGRSRETAELTRDRIARLIAHHLQPALGEFGRTGRMPNDV